MGRLDYAIEDRRVVVRLSRDVGRQVDLRRVADHDVGDGTDRQGGDGGLEEVVPSGRGERVVRIVGHLGLIRRDHGRRQGVQVERPVAREVVELVGPPRLERGPSRLRVSLGDQAGETRGPGHAGPARRHVPGGDFVVHEPDRVALGQVDDIESVDRRGDFAHPSVVVECREHGELADLPCGAGPNVRSGGDEGRIGMPEVDVYLEGVRVDDTEPAEHGGEGPIVRVERVGVMGRDVPPGAAGNQRDVIQDVVHVHRRTVVPVPEGVVERDL